MSREREVVVVEVEDRPGVLADLTRRVAKAGIDLDLVYALASPCAGGLSLFDSMNGVRLMVVGNSLEAETICGLLRTEGIACNHRQTDVGAGAGDAVGDSGPREILVAQDDLERARELVNADSG